MKKTVEFEIPSWNQIHKMLINQSVKILTDNFKPDIIIAITRGGWIPARLLSDLLEVHDLITIGIEFYLDISKTRKKPILTQKLSTPISGKKILLVDDVADTGESLQLAKNHILKKDKADLKILTLYKKPQSIIEPDYYEKITKRWIIFPWDIKETARKIWNRNEGLESKKTSLTEAIVKKFLKEFAEGNH
jgi:hypoxanthine phosphoribosyltransferase